MGSSWFLQNPINQANTTKTCTLTRAFAEATDVKAHTCPQFKFCTPPAHYFRTGQCVTDFWPRPSRGTSPVIIANGMPGYSVR